MPSQGIVSGKAVPTLTRIWLHAAMNFGMAFEIVLSDEAFLAVGALELSVSEMGLDVRLDVLLPSKAFLAIRVETNPFSIERIRSRNEGSNVVNSDSSLSNRFVRIDA
jgi:hypothetical protein